MWIKILIAVLVTALIVFLITWKAAIAYRIKVYEAKIGEANKLAEEIKAEAEKSAETMKREALLEAKEEALKAKNDFDREKKNSVLNFSALKRDWYLRKKILIGRRKPSRRRNSE